MNDLRTAAQQALEALIHMCHNTVAEKGYDGKRVQNAIDGLEAALEQPEQEWLTGCPRCGMDDGCDCEEGTYNPPRRREWQSLSMGEALTLWGMRSDGPSNGEIAGFARAIEQALKEKNQ